MAVVGEDNFTITRWSGIFLDQDPQFIADSELAVCTNFLLGENGVLEKRKPVIRLFAESATPNPGSLETIRMVGELIRATQTYTLWHDHGAGQSYYTTGLSTSLVLIPGLSGQIVWSACQYINELFVSCESKIYVWTPDGGASLISSSPPGIRQIVAINDRLFGFVRSELYWSDPGEPQTWDPTSVLTVSDGDGDDIQCIIPYDGRLVIFKNSSTWVLHFADDPTFWILNWLNFEIGCRGPGAAKLYRNVIYIIDRNGCWATDTVTFRKLSNPIDPYFADSKRLLVQLDIFSDHVSIYKDWVIFHQKFAGQDWAYRTTDPQGFTSIVWNAPGSGGQLPNNLWFDIKEQKIHGQNGRFILSLGNAVYYLTDYGTSGAEAVQASVTTKYYDIARVSHTKRMKHAYAVMTVQNSLGQGIQYRWITDDENPGAYQNFTSPFVDGHTKSINTRGADYSRVVGISIQESNPNPYYFKIFAINYVLMLHRQQSENLQ